MLTPSGLCISKNQPVKVEIIVIAIQNSSVQSRIPLTRWLIPCSAPCLITIEQERLRVLKVNRMVMRLRYKGVRDLNIFCLATILIIVLCTCN